MAIYPLSKMVLTTFPTVLDFFHTYLFIITLYLKNTLLGIKRTENPTQVSKLDMWCKICLFFAKKIISPKKYIFRFFRAKNHIFCHYRPQNVHLRKCCYLMEKKHILHHISNFGISGEIFVCFMPNNVIFRYRVITNK